MTISQNHKNSLFGSWVSDGSNDWPNERKLRFQTWPKTTISFLAENRFYIFVILEVLKNIWISQKSKLLFRSKTIISKIHENHKKFLSVFELFEFFKNPKKSNNRSQKNAIFRLISHILMGVFKSLKKHQKYFLILDLSAEKGKSTKTRKIITTFSSENQSSQKDQKSKIDFCLFGEFLKMSCKSENHNCYGGQKSKFIKRTKINFYFQSI